jgi:hypothetical protein
MNLENIEKKLREARFFLEQMREWEDRAFGRDKEPFDFFLSAHLSAGKSVDWRLCREQPAYRAWRTAWNDSHPKEDALLKFLADDRALEVHRSGSGRTANHVQIPFRGEYSDKSGTATILMLLRPMAPQLSKSKYIASNSTELNDQWSTSAPNIAMFLRTCWLSLRPATRCHDPHCHQPRRLRGDRRHSPAWLGNISAGDSAMAGVGRADRFF